MKYDREKLYNEVWAEPVSTVSKRYGISNAALAKACRQRGIPLPPRGYWAKAKAGKPVMERPELPPEPRKEKEPEKKEIQRDRPKRKTIQRNSKASDCRKDCQAFYHNYMISLDDLLYHFDFLIEKTDEQFSDHSKYYRKRRKQFLKQCRNQVTCMHLPLLTNEWTYYNCSESVFGFEVTLSKLSELEYEGLDIVYTTEDQIGTLIEFDYPLVTLEEFAAVHEVTLEAVDEWLHMGRLYGAVYEEGIWMIPELQQKPDEERSTMCIELLDSGRLEMEEYPLLKCCQEIRLFPQDNGEVELIYVNQDQNFKEGIMISKKECGELLYGLQKQGVSLDDRGAYLVPIFERPEQFMEDVCRKWSSIVRRDE